MMIDNHIHTNYSKDARGSIMDLKAVILNKGLKQVSVTNHSELPPGFHIEGSCGIESDKLKQYKQDVEALRSSLPGVTVNYGCEIDYIEGYDDWIRNYTRQFEFAIGSVHCMRNLCYDKDKEHFRLAVKTIGGLKNFLKEYFRLVGNVAKMGCFDVLGHLDYVKRFELKIQEESYYMEFVDSALVEVAKSGIVLDVNTAALEFLDEPYPGYEILKQARTLEIPITLGSDAHRPEQVARHFDRVIPKLKEIGYTEIISFEGHEKTAIKLD